jgi:hypothetical protein|tara:strand:+ start:1551 stop:1691 length:141 start_codon:yes stop_codon:yes gene_type:complete
MAIEPAELLGERGKISSPNCKVPLASLASFGHMVSFVHDPRFLKVE